VPAAPLDRPRRWRVAFRRDGPGITRIKRIDNLFFTTMAAAALAAGISPSALSPEPAWLNDYSAAQVRATAVRKPMAVFLGSGTGGWGKVVRDGALDPELKRTLASKFVCVYVDTDTAVGRSLAGAFEVASKGLVISDRAGTSQAFSLSGDLTRDELSRTLAKYADPDREVRTTDSVVREVPAVVQPVVVRQPVYVQQPVVTYPVAPQPAYLPQYRPAPGYYTSGST
jgi:hypothetical protein